MNERIKELAEKAGVSFHHALGATYTYGKLSEILERFAELVRDDERAKCATDYLQDCCDAIDAARLEEREACAKLCEARGNLHDRLFGNWAQDIAERIRARSKHD